MLIARNIISRYIRAEFYFGIMLFAIAMLANSRVALLNGLLAALVVAHAALSLKLLSPLRAGPPLVLLLGAAHAAAFTGMTLSLMPAVQAFWFSQPQSDARYATLGFMAALLGTGVVFGAIALREH